MADGSIEFSVELDAKDAERELSRLKKEINRLEDDTSVKTAARDRLSEQLKEIEAAYKKAIAGGDDETAKAMVKDYDSVAGKLATINEQLEVNADKLRVAKERAADYARQLAESPEPPAPEPEPGGGGGSSRRAESPSAAGRVASALARRTKNFAAQWKRVHSYLSNSVGRLRLFSGLTNGLGRMMKRILGLAGGAFIFSQISGGFRTLRTSMEDMLQTNTNLMMALTRFKGALKTAFLPIYEIAVPALTALLNLLTRILGTVASFTAALTGKSAKEIKATAAALDEEADATEATGKAAKDASKPLASFDEINKLDSKDTGGGAGGTDALALEDMEFPEVELKSWGEMLDAFFDKLLGKLPQLEDFFKRFADRLNEFNRKLLEAFTFPGLLDKVKALGAGLAEAFNKLVDYVDWYTLGAALGAGLNLALGFLVSYIYGFDWIALGKALADGFNGFVSQINWYDFGRLLWAGFKIALETLAGFLIGLDMPQLAKAASNIVKGFFDSMTETITKIDWAEIGRQIARFLKNVDWSGLLTSVWEAVKAAIKAGIEMISAFIKEMGPEAIIVAISAMMAIIIGKHAVTALIKTAVKAILAYLGGVPGLIIAALASGIVLISAYFREKAPSIIIAGIAALVAIVAGKISLTALLAPIVTAIGTALSGVVSAIVAFLAGWPGLIIAAVAAAIVLIVAWMENGGKEVVAGWLKGMSEALSNLGAWIKEHIFDPFISWIKNLFGIHSPSTVMAEIGRDLILGLLQGITETWTQIVAFFAGVFEALKQAFAETWAAIKAAAEAVWNAIKQSAITIWNAIKSALVTIWNELKATATTIWTAVKTFFQQTWEAIRQNAVTVWNTIKQMLTAVWNELKAKATEIFTAVKTFLAQTWSEIKAKATEAWNSVKTTLITIWNEIKAKATELWNAIKKVITDAWNAVRSKTTEIWNAIKTSLSTTWNAIKSAASTSFTAIKDTVLGIWRALGDGIKSVCNNILSGIESWINGIIRGINSLLSVINQAGSALGSTLGLGNVNLHLSEVRLPRLAQGAVIPPNREFLAVLGDQSSGTNIETPLSTMVEAFRQALGEGGAQRTIVLQLDRRELGRAVVDVYNLENSRVGVSV